MKTTIVSFLFIISFVAAIPAQSNRAAIDELVKTGSFNKKFKKANSLMKKKQYDLALILWEDLAGTNGDNSNLEYQKGLCYLESNLTTQKAIESLSKAEKNISTQYKNSAKEKSAPLATEYYLAKAYHLNMNLKLAKEKLDLFMKNADKDNELMKEAELEQAQLNTSIVLVDIKKSFRIKNINQPINDKTEDFGPVVTADGNTIFFTSRRKRSASADESNEGMLSKEDHQYYQDIYVSYRNVKTGKWSQPELMKFSLPGSHQGAISASADGQFLFVYQQVKGQGDIYVAERDGFEYGDLKKLESNINTKYEESHAAISADGRTLYFTSNRPGGFGGFDLYRCVRLPNGEWSLATNLGPTVNTPYNEISPFLHVDGHRLFFSSNNEKSIGGFDIFFSDLLDGNRYEKPENVGFPFNSPYDDNYFSTTADGMTGFFSSTNAKEGLGAMDIYTIDFRPPPIEQVAILRGYIDLKEGQKLPDNLVIVVTEVGNDGGESKLYMPDPRSNAYIFNLTPCKEYKVEYTLNDETFSTTQFKVPCKSGYQEINKVIKLKNVSLDQIPEKK